jgi:amino acid transporter
MFLNFLMAWTTEHQNLHAAVVGIFCICGMIHLILMRQKGIKNGLSTTSLQIAILAFAFIIVMVVMTVAGTKNFGYLFWATECVALSGLILYTLFLILMGEKHMDRLEKYTALYFNCLCNI